MAPRASAIKEHSFSETVAAQIKAPQPDKSMRQSGPFLQSGVPVIRWTSGRTSLLLQQLTKIPFEPLKEASLNHLT